MRTALLLVLAGQPGPPVSEPLLTSSWEAPPGCPALADVRAAIDRRLGRPLAVDEVAWAGHVALARAAPRYRLTLRLAAGGRHETRHLTADRCAALADATALLVTLAVRQASEGESAAGVPGATADEPGETLAPVEPAVGTAGVPAPPDRADEASRAPEDGLVPGVAVDAPEPAPSLDAPAPDGVASRSAGATGRAGPLPARRLGGLLRVQGGAEVGALPGVTGVVGLAGALLWRRARLELHGNYLAPRTAARTEGSLRAFVAAAGVQGCGRPGRGRLEVPLCGGLELGAMRGEPVGVPAPQGRTGLWLAGVATVGLAVRLHPRWSLWTAVQAVVRVAWPRFELRDPGPPVRLFEPAPVSGRLVAGVEFRFADPW